jgi:hypothetical protein
MDAQEILSQIRNVTTLDELHAANKAAVAWHVANLSVSPTAEATLRLNAQFKEMSHELDRMELILKNRLAEEVKQKYFDSKGRLEPNPIERVAFLVTDTLGITRYIAGSSKSDEEKKGALDIAVMLAELGLLGLGLYLAVQIVLLARGK